MHDPPDVFAGGGQVIASGTLIPFSDSDLVQISIGPVEERLAIQFRFEEGPFGPEPGIEVLRDGAKKITLVLHNFGGPTGAGTTNPLKLGTLEGQQLYVHFRVFRVGTTPRIFHYTFYQRDDEEIRQGQLRALRPRNPLGFDD